MTDDALHGLREKYAEMLRLRRLHAAPNEPDPRADLVALASRFPGALREIDELPLETIEARLRAIDEALRDPARAPSWMRAMARFHELARGALAVKRWLAGRRAVDAATLAAFARDAEALAGAALEWRDELAEIARPPRGRITALVYQKLARELATSAEDARHLVFGPPRNVRRI